MQRETVEPEPEATEPEPEATEPEPIEPEPTATPSTPAEEAEFDDYETALIESGCKGVPNTDQWCFYSGHATSYVAWRINEVRFGGADWFDNQYELKGSDRWGDAHEWDDAARLAGITVNRRPAVGSIAQWEKGLHGPKYGSVAYVERMTLNDDGFVASIVISDMNSDGESEADNSRTWNLRPAVVCTPQPEECEPFGWPDNFIHIPEPATSTGTEPSPTFEPAEADDYRSAVILGGCEGAPNSDQWCFFAGHATSYVAWRLNTVHFGGENVFNNQYRVSRPDRWGNAHEWDNTASHLVGLTVDAMPSVGSVAQWEAQEFVGGHHFGFVAYVESVVDDKDGSIVSIVISDGNADKSTDERDRATWNLRPAVVCKPQPEECEPLGWPDNFIHIIDP